MNSQSKYPTYNPDTDGNKFEWILRQATALRERQESVADQPRPSIDYLTRKPKQHTSTRKT
jgi:hypothetical protein